MEIVIAKVIGSIIFFVSICVLLVVFCDNSLGETMKRLMEEK